MNFKMITSVFTCIQNNDYSLFLKKYCIDATGLSHSGYHHRSSECTPFGKAQLPLMFSVNLNE